MSGSTFETVATIADLRLISGGSTLPIIFVQGYASTADGGEGTFVYNPADTASADNGGTIIIDASGVHRYYRETNGLSYSIKWFGATGNGTTDDSAAIQSTFNALPSGGGAAFFPAGNYLINSAITIPHALLQSEPLGGVSMYGEGIGISTITSTISQTFFSCKVPSDKNAFNLFVSKLAFYATEPDYDAWHFTCQNVCRAVFTDCLFKSGNTLNTAVAGLQMTGEVGGVNAETFYCVIEGCQFQGASISLNNVGDSWIRKNVITAITGSGGRNYGVLVAGSYATELKFDENHIHAAQNGGIWLDGASALCTTIRDNFFDTNQNVTTAASILANSGGPLLISNNCFAGIPSYAIDAIDISNSIISGNIFYNCGNTNGNDTPTILFTKNSTGCIQNLVYGNCFVQNTALSPQVAAIYENPGSVSGNIYGMNSVAGVGYSAQPFEFQTGLGDSLLVPNTGFATKASGTIAISSSSTSATANHDLSYTPSLEDFTLTAISAWGHAAKVWVSNVTATQFTIDVDTAPGATLTFGWRVEYRATFSDV
jgi:hypothetical protein